MCYLKIKVPSKINLSLQVLNKREDLFHNINSLFVPIYSLYDEIIISENPTFEFECNLDLGIKNEKNIAYLAAIKMIEEYKISPKFKISLFKNIPSGGGLGGGSSDAASVIKGLHKFCKINHNLKNNFEVNNNKLFKIAEELGSDVPFFIGDSAAIVKGRGEILDFINFNINGKLLMIIPDFKISTPLAYKNLNRKADEKYDLIDYYPLINEINFKPELMKMNFVNDFVHNKMEYYEEITYIINTLYKHKAVYSNMSGSGSSCFAIFTDSMDVEKIKKSFPENYRIILC